MAGLQAAGSGTSSQIIGFHMINSMIFPCVILLLNNDNIHDNVHKSTEYEYSMDVQGHSLQFILSLWWFLPLSLHNWMVIFGRGEVN